MTTRPFRPRLPEIGPDEIFPDFPPRDDMQNPIYLHDPGYQAALRLKLGDEDNTVVLGEVPLGRRPGLRGTRIPDLLIAFGVNRAGVIARNGYSIDEQGKPPDFVLEIASPTTSRNDYTAKRRDYAAFGVPEYWRFDPTGGRLYPEALAGDRLDGDAYVPIHIDRVDDGEGGYRYWGRSEALGLDLCWEYGQLRWYDPATGRYLRTHAEETEGRMAAEAGRDAERRAREDAETERDSERQAREDAETERDSERQAREDAETERDSERQAREDAETERDSERRAREVAEAHARELEERLRRLQDP